MNIISIHIFPHEIQDYIRIIEELSRASKYIEPSLIKIKSVLNLNDKLLKWKNLSSRQVVIDEFKKTNKRCKNIRIDGQIKNTISFLGVNEHRRETIEQSSENDSIIFLDSDLHFNEKILYHLLKEKNKITKFIDNYIITPCTIKLWDDTWDIITHPSFLSKSHNYHKSADIKKIVSNEYTCNKKITAIADFKWGGGWFNVISARLLKKIGIPNSFVGYGPDDTFAMECCKIMRQKGYKVQQITLNNMIVCEDKNPRRTHTEFNEHNINFRVNCNNHFQTELIRFSRKL